MPKLKKKSDRDIEKAYPVKMFIAKLRRLADCLEKGKDFRYRLPVNVYPYRRMRR